MIKLDAQSNKPKYLQIVDTVKTLVMTSKMHPHEQLPSVRKLAGQLQINPNTVQKAYAILEKQEIIYTKAGKGDFVADNAAMIKSMNREKIVELFEEATREAKAAGLWIDEIFNMVDEMYSRP